jgi:ABC-2 type transport system ATP-binding protein
MNEVQDMADQVVVAGRGKVLADATVEELVTRASGNRILLRTPTLTDAANALERAAAVVTRVDASTLAVSGVAAQGVVEVLGQAGVPFSEVSAQRATLEDVYLQLTGGEAEFHAGFHGEEQR